MIIATLKKLAPLIKSEITCTIRHRISQIKALKYKNTEGLQLHLACGTNYKKNWVNIDLYSDRADLNLDLRKPLPFSGNSCSRIYCEHFLEHLEYPVAAELFIRELYRVLGKSGVATVEVPDTVWPIKSYLKGKDARYFSICISKKWHPKWIKTPMEHLNFHFRQAGEHQFAYDFFTLKKILIRCGFRKVTKRKFNKEIDSTFHFPGSIYVDCLK